MEINLLNSSTKIRILVLEIVILIIIQGSVNAQFTDAPHLNYSIRKVSEYIASKEFKNVTEIESASSAIDSLYKQALTLCNYNISETLLTLTFATLPYHHIPLNIPIINTKFEIPLPSTNKILFNRKIKNLPVNIYFKSDSKYSDRDKLAHFFGNAYLSYNLSFFNISKFISIFVELFESSFKVEGAVDYRDLQVDMLGENFGLALRKNRNLTPSKIHYYYYFFYTTMSL